eukprot:TRINITY_DN1460_c0_g1_i1.p1 TRINITY_DN1460_c0_g1~~TRINITY_DN1460_c0_g1_i1.p1  ORF type:complete len:711 (-),score=111.50 TRINITY_DN1460_c0_g1_i1:71-2203(-)
MELIENTVANQQATSVSGTAPTHSRTVHPFAIEPPTNNSNPTQTKSSTSSARQFSRSKSAGDPQSLSLLSDNPFPESSNTTNTNLRTIKSSKRDTVTTNATEDKTSNSVESWMDGVELPTSASYHLDLDSETGGFVLDQTPGTSITTNHNTSSNTTAHVSRDKYPATSGTQYEIPDFISEIHAEDELERMLYTTAQSAITTSTALRKGNQFRLSLLLGLLLFPIAALTTYFITTRWEDIVLIERTNIADLTLPQRLGWDGIGTPILGIFILYLVTVVLPLRSNFRLIINSDEGYMDTVHKYRFIILMGVLFIIVAAILPFSIPVFHFQPFAPAFIFMALSLPSFILIVRSWRQLAIRVSMTSLFILFIGDAAVRLAYALLVPYLFFYVCTEEWHQMLLVLGTHLLIDQMGYIVFRQFGTMVELCGANDTHLLMTIPLVNYSLSLRFFVFAIPSMEGKVICSLLLSCLLIFTRSKSRVFDNMFYLVSGKQYLLTSDSSAMDADIHDHFSLNSETISISSIVTVCMCWMLMGLNVPNIAESQPLTDVLLSAVFQLLIEGFMQTIYSTIVVYMGCLFARAWNPQDDLLKVLDDIDHHENRRPSANNWRMSRSRSSKTAATEGGETNEEEPRFWMCRFSSRTIRTISRPFALPFAKQVRLLGTWMNPPNHTTSTIIIFYIASFFLWYGCCIVPFTYGVRDLKSNISVSIMYSPQ